MSNLIQTPFEYKIATPGPGDCASGHVFDRTGRSYPADGTVCACGQTMFVAKEYQHSVVTVRRDEMVQAVLFE